VLKDAATHHQLAVTLRMVSEQKLPRDKEYLSTESKERKKKKDTDAKRLYDRKVREYYTALKNNFSAAIEKLPQSVKRDPRQRHEAEQKIQDHLLTPAKESKQGPRRHAAQLFQEWLAAGGKKKH
jgi:hypothetical protein